MKLSFVHNLPLAETMQFEEIYPTNLQLDIEVKQWIKDNGGEFIYMKDEDTGIIIGETYFIPVDELEYEEPTELQLEDGLDGWYGKNALYVYSTSILPEYQKQGLGKVLKSYFYGFIKTSQYDYVIGHARRNGSIQLNEFFGAEVIDEFENWFQTGETVSMYKKAL